jgi:hypothetical protein
LDIHPPKIRATISRFYMMTRTSLSAAALRWRGGPPWWATPAQRDHSARNGSSQPQPFAGPEPRRVYADARRGFPEGRGFIPSVNDPGIVSSRLALTHPRKPCGSRLLKQNAAALHSQALALIHPRNPLAERQPSRTNRTPSCSPPFAQTHPRNPSSGFLPSRTNRTSACPLPLAQLHPRKLCRSRLSKENAAGEYPPPLALTHPRKHSNACTRSKEKSKTPAGGQRYENPPLVYPEARKAPFHPRNPFLAAEVLIANLKLEFHLTHRKLCSLRISNRKFSALLRSTSLVRCSPALTKGTVAHAGSESHATHHRSLVAAFLIHGSAIKTRRNSFNNSNFEISNRRLDGGPRST